MKPESYPFLRIARQFNVDYSDVLALAHLFQRGGSVQRWPASLDHVVEEISEACTVQKAVRSGVIDWNTGAPLS